MSNDTKRARTMKCPVCGHEAWPIVYGMVMSDARDENPKTEFAGCCMDYEQRVYPATGKVELGIPKWACQDLECRHRWW